MNTKEITREILNDYHIITTSSTFTRLANEYYHERKKLNVKREADYVKFYDIKTKSKNNWVIILSKDISHKKYEHIEDGTFRLFVYYYNCKDICVLQTGPSKKIGYYYGHMFKRYRERMELNIPDLMDVIKHFFINIYLPYHKYYRQADGQLKMIALTKEGFIMGEINEEDHWTIYKTFIGRKTANSMTTSEEKAVINKLRETLLYCDKKEDKDLIENLEIIYRNLTREVSDFK